MDPIFEHPVFDSAREKMKNVLQDSLKNHRKLLKTRCTLVSNVVAIIYFLLQNKSGLLMRKHHYSMSVVIVTINGGMDDTHVGIQTILITSDILGYDIRIKVTLFGSLKIITSYMIQ